MQDGIRCAGWNFQEVNLIKMHAGWKKFPKLIKCAGWNKACRMEFLRNSLSKNACRMENFPKLIKCAGWNKGVQVGIFQKIDNCAAHLLDRLE